MKRDRKVIVVVAVLAPILGEFSYLQFRGGFSTPLLLVGAALHLLIAFAACALPARKSWTRGLLLASLTLVSCWYAYALAMGLLGLAGGALADPTMRLDLVAYFGACLAGLCGAVWLLLRGRLGAQPEPNHAESAGDA